MLPAPPCIGGIQLDSVLALAPMSGYADPAFRREARRVGGFSLAYTELVNPRALVEGNPNSEPIVALHPEDRPLAVQLYGADGGALAEAAALLIERGARILDFNLGCPVRKVTRKGGGAALLSRPEEAARLAGLLVKLAAGRAPVTAKLRLGPTRGALVAPELARRLEAAGVAMLAVHGRFADQNYSAPVDLEGIRQVVAAVRIPVFGNGDVNSAESARLMIEVTGAAGVLIGRAALAKPWIFQEIGAELAGRKFTPPARAERVAFLRGHFRGLVGLLGEELACRSLRKWARWYGASLGLAREERLAFGKLHSAGELEGILGGP